MPTYTEADTIRILVATDNHVGFEERDPIRKDDSWRAFDEIIQLARTEDVDMVLLGGDLFHDNKPSRKSMYQVMRTLRKNCLGMKPCELEFLSDANEVFDGAFSHVNYEDPDINISIPVFSIHGNHDDPSGDGHFCSLDLLQCAGLVNYFGRIPEADNIGAKPVLLQKGQTKVALYGLSNVRDERMFRTFRDNKVKWFRPGQQQKDWFNLLTVHQNHHAHGPTNYLPENVLPDWMDLIVWGHEHECLIDPSQNPETGFHVMQPGSSVATSLVPGEAVSKHVAVLSVTAKEFKVEKIPLKTVRPFVTRELVLANDPKFRGLEHKKENRQELTKRLMEVVDDMIETANQDWETLQDGEDIDPEDRPLPLIRLKVEYTAPESGRYDCENPQRFSNRFVGRVANVNDVVYFYRKKTQTRTKMEADVPDGAMAALELDEAIKVESLVDEFLAAQSLKILPQQPFGDAVSQFVNKDDKHAMETFLSESLKGQQKQMLNLDPDDDDLDGAMEEGKKRLEAQFAKGQLRQGKRRCVKDKPDNWDSDMDGHWEDQPGVVYYEKIAPVEEDTPAARAPAAKERGRARASKNLVVDEDDDVFMEVAPAPAPAKKTTARGRAAATKKTSTAAPKKAPAARKALARGKKKPVFEISESEEEEEPQDDMILDDDDDDEEDEAGPFTHPPKRTAGRAAAHARTSRSATGSQASGARGRTTAAATRSSQRAGTQRQTTLNFSSQLKSQGAVEISDDEISEDDAFESMPAPRTRRKK